MVENKFFDKINLEHYHRYVSGMIKNLSDNIGERIDEKFKNFIEDNVSDGEILDSRGGERTLGDRLNKLDEKYSEVSSQLVHINDSLNYKKVDGIAFSVKSDFMGMLETHINKIKEYGTTGQMVVFASVSNITGIDIETNTNEVMDTAFNYVNNTGLEISLMKVHLVCNFKDGAESYRKQIAPSKENEGGFFDNYKKALVFYLEYCKNNNINKLCLANENTSLVKQNRFLPKWKALISELKLLYPDIELSYSMNSEDKVYFTILSQNNIENLLDYLDFVSLNIYPRISDSPLYDAYEKESDYINKLYSTNIIQDLIDIHNCTKKDIVISEIGCTHYDSSLYHPEEVGTTHNADVQGVYYNTVLNTIAKCDFIKGTYIWHVSEPFTFYNTKAEEVLKNYFGGVK